MNVSSRSLKIGQSSDGGGLGLKFFKIIIYSNIEPWLFTATKESGRNSIVLQLADRQTTGAVVFSDREELAQYKAMQGPGACDSPLVFWRQNQKYFPVLSQVARRVFCISASSAESERDFSSIGHTITDTRSRLSAGKVESIELIRWGYALACHAVTETCLSSQMFNVD